ncbi:MAG: DUF5719 family protein, partial [Actinomycetota bacterium]
MSRRAIPGLLVVVLGLVGLIVVGRSSDERPTPIFAATGQSWMPAVGASGSLTGSWFCPGVPSTGEAGVGGDVVVSNRDSQQLVGRFTIITDEGVVEERSVTIDAWEQTTIDVDSFATADFAGVVVEIEGGGGLVEQIVEHPAGRSVDACSNVTSDRWYFADGFTLDGSIETLVLTNPFDEPVVADLRFATEGREARPNQFQGFTIAPRSVRTVRIAELGARDEPVISVAIEATAGRLVAGRAQHYTGGGRLGYDVSLGSPALREQWWFADGEQGLGITETFSLYNPTDDPVEVTVFFGGLPLSSGVADLDPIEVPPRRVVVFDPSEDLVPSTDAEGPEADDSAFDVFDAATELPEGRHGTVFSTLAQPSIVVDRVITRPTDDGSLATSIVQGAVPRDGFVASTWHLGVSVEEPTEDAIVVYNIDQTDSTITVEAVGPGGPFEVPSLTEVALPRGSIITIDLTDPDVIDQELIVRSTSRVFVERLLPLGGELSGRDGSWLLPSAT